MKFFLGFLYNNVVCPLLLDIWSAQGRGKTRKILIDKEFVQKLVKHLCKKIGKQLVHKNWQRVCAKNWQTVGAQQLAKSLYKNLAYSWCTKIGKRPYVGADRHGWTLGSMCVCWHPGYLGEGGRITKCPETRICVEPCQPWRVIPKSIPMCGHDK